MNIPISRLLRLWGKTERNNNDSQVFHPVLFHMLDVGHVARELLGRKASPRWRKVMSDVLGANADMVVDWLPWLVAMHDVGKISAAFQQADEGQRYRLEAEGFSFGNRKWGNRPYHALISAAFIDNGGYDLDLPVFLRQAWSDALAGHHGEFSGREARNETNYLLQAEPSEWAELRREAFNILKSVLLIHPPDPWPSPLNLSSATMALTGFTILCDWIGSDGVYFKPKPGTDWQRYIAWSISKAREAVEASGLFQPTVSDAPVEFSGLFSGLAEPRPLQLAIDIIPNTILSKPCLTIIEAPTGEGKTEAALALAHRLAQANGSDELFYALPTTATSNQMFHRVQQYVEKQLGLSSRVGLVHGQAFLLEDDFLTLPLQNGKMHNAASDWFGSDKRKSLLVPFGVGTIDQAELAALNVRFTVLRLMGLAGKVVIFDEVHAYDTYMTTIIERLLNWLAALGTTVILLSATLPTSRREVLIRAYVTNAPESPENRMAYPMLSVVSRAGIYLASPTAFQPDRQLSIGKIHLGDEESKAKACWLLNSIDQGGCACWVTNTVDRAQKIYEQVAQIAPPDVECMLLHARFPLDDRHRLETELTAKYGAEGMRPTKGIVIGTQVLEQSLDLDFDVMVSDLAPMDFLLQRAGRLHRHSHHVRPEGHDRPHLWLNIPLADDGTPLLTVDALVYDEFILRQTWQVLSERKEIHLPADYRPLVEMVYDDRECPSDGRLQMAWEKLQKKQEKARNEAMWRVLPEPTPESSFCGQLAHLTFEENESKAIWMVAQTRLGEESLTVIPLERDGNLARLWPGSETFALEDEAPRKAQKKLMRRSIRTSNHYLIAALKAQEAQRPPLFTKSALLKECYPLWLIQGKTQITDGKGVLSITLHPQLGLLIEKYKEANE
jgi:CRISPR-associated endonuclease/helicase Cas3